MTRVTHDHHQPSSCYLSMLHHTGPEHSATGKYENRLKGFKHFNSRMAHTWPGEAVFYFTVCRSDPVCQLLAVMDGWCPHRPLTASSQELSFSLFFSPQQRLLRAVLISGLKWADLSSELSSTDPYHDHDPYRGQVILNLFACNYFVHLSYY